MKWLVYILCFVFCAQPLLAQDDSTYTKVEVRTFDSKSMQEMKADPELQYDLMKEPKLSWWDRFWMWFWWNVNQMMKTRQGKATVWSILIILALGLLAFAFYKIRQMNKGGVFAAGSGKGLDFTVGHEDIHQINFDEAISQAVAQKDFRLAVRLLYLQTLKRLADNSIIDWRVNKTNNDYVREVAGKNWQPLFSQLTYQFEYAWYGETAVSEEKFSVLQNDFKHLHNQV